MANGVSWLGSSGDDDLSGATWNNGDDTIDGYLGNDFLVGGRGNDLVYGGDGRDTLLGGGGEDTLAGGRGSDTFIADFADSNTYYGDFQNGDEGGIDLVDYGTYGSSVKVTLAPAGAFGFADKGGGSVDYFKYIENVAGGSGSDVVNGNAASNTFYGRDGRDRLNGEDGFDTLVGGEGDDTLNGGRQNDVLYGDEGADVIDGGDDGYDATSYRGSTAGVRINLTAGTGAGGHAQGDTLRSVEEIVASNFADTLLGSGAAENLRGLDGADVISGLAGDDYLEGDAGADTMSGGDGSDSINGGSGNDRMAGGAGNDRYGINDAGDRVIELAQVGGFGQGIDEIESTISLTLAANVENLTLAGSANLNGTGNELFNDLQGNSGANVLNGAAGYDTMQGHGGDDTYRVEETGDRVVEAAGGGVDTVVSSVSRTLEAEVENLTLAGSARLDGTGNALNNRMVGNAGANELLGGEGHDVLDGRGGADLLIGGGGNDTADYSAFAGSRVNLSATRAQNTGAAGADRLIDIESLLGGAGADVFIGNGLGNGLTGGGGNDVLNGGGGADGLTGGAGNDRFVFSSTADANGDVIIDFNLAGDDTMALTAIDANTLLGGDQAFSFIGASGFTGVAGQLRYQQVTPPGVPGPIFVVGDVNGDTQADFVIQLQFGFGGPTAADFLL